MSHQLLWNVQQRILVSRFSLNSFFSLLLLLLQLILRRWHSCLSSNHRKSDKCKIEKNAFSFVNAGWFFLVGSKNRIYPPRGICDTIHTFWPLLGPWLYHLLYLISPSRGYLFPRNKRTLKPQSSGQPGSWTGLINCGMKDIDRI